MKQEAKPTTQAFSYRVKDFPKNLRPRERLRQGSAQDLSDAELLAILLRSGLPGTNVVALATAVLTQVGGLRGLREASVETLEAVPGIGEAKAVTLLAAGELARRFSLLGLDPSLPISSQLQAQQALLSLVGQWDQEVFLAIYLNQRGHLLAKRTLFQGTVNESLVHPRDVYREAVRHNATQVIVGHTHPGGSLVPSAEDRQLTERLQAAGELMGIVLQDHLILTPQGESYSFRAHHLL